MILSLGIALPLIFNLFTVSCINNYTYETIQNSHSPGNAAFKEQIANGEIYCYLNIYIDYRLLDHFNNRSDLIDFVKKGISLANEVLVYSFSYMKKPMIQYHIKSISVQNVLNEYYHDPEIFIDQFNHFVYKNFDERYCQSVYMTASDWGFTLGAAYITNLNKNLDAPSLCQDPYSSIVMTTFLKKRLVTPETFAFIFLHESGHTLGLDHDIIPLYSLFMHSNESMSFSDIIKTDNGNSRVLRFYVMSSVTGMHTSLDEITYSPISASNLMISLFYRGKNCFKALTNSSCGDGILQDGEECDAFDKCCVKPSFEGECHLENGAQCLISDGPCCNDECKFSSNLSTCIKENECSYKVMCSGLSSTCEPSPKPRSNMEYCDSNTALCDEGLCSLSLCYKYNLVPCNMPQITCLTSCMDDNEKCFPFQINSANSFIKDGTPCNYDKGLCKSGICVRKKFNQYPEFYKNDDNKRHNSLNPLIISAVVVILIVIFLCIILVSVKRCRAHNATTLI